MTTKPAPRNPTQELVARLRSDEFLKQVSLALPDTVRPERFVRAVITAVMQNPDVTVDPESLFQSAIRAAQDGLIPDGREAAFVVIRDHGRKRVVYWPMVGGFRKIAAQHGFTLVADVVREGDSFKWSRLPPMIEHKPALTDRGQIVCAYAAGFRADWTFASAPVVMDVTEIEKARAVSRAGDSGPWKTWWDRMAAKTVARRAFTELPIFDLTEADSRVIQADDADLSGQEADTIMRLANVPPPELPGPDDTPPVEEPEQPTIEASDEPTNTEPQFQIPGDVRKHLDEPKEKK
jgi:recombination protein RecT